MEGEEVIASATFSDPAPDDSPFTCSVNYGNGAGTQVGQISGATCTGSAHPYADDGTYTVTITVTDKDGATSSASTTHTVTNAAPEVGAISVTPNPPVIAVDTSVSTTVPFSDAGILDTHTAVGDWGDGTLCDSATDIDCAVIESGGVGTATGSHTYIEAGVYTVGVTVSDELESASTTYEFVVVYDPDGGFVTGGGWIDSPEGACQLNWCDETTVCRANFGFVSK